MTEIFALIVLAAFCTAYMLPVVLVAVFWRPKMPSRLPPPDPALQPLASDA